jgi:hypothetical protein
MTKRQFAVVLAVAVVAAFLGATARDWVTGQPAYAQTGTIDVVSAHQFRLVGPDDEVRATLAASAAPSWGLTLYDDAGQRRGAFDLTSNGDPRLGLFDTQGNIRAWMVLLEDGRPALVMRNAQGKAGILLRMRPDGTGELSLLDEAERARIVLGQDDSKRWGMNVKDTGGGTTWKAP